MPLLGSSLPTCPLPAWSFLASLWNLDGQVGTWFTTSLHLSSHFDASHRLLSSVHSLVFLGRTSPHCVPSTLPPYCWTNLTLSLSCWDGKLGCCSELTCFRLLLVCSAKLSCSGPGCLSCFSWVWAPSDLRSMLQSWLGGPCSILCCLSVISFFLLRDLSFSHLLYWLQQCALHGAIFEEYLEAAAGAELGGMSSFGCPMGCIWKTLFLGPT